MNTAKIALFVCLPILAASAQTDNKPAAPNKHGFQTYHAGPWEEQIGYTQAVRVGDRLILSGTVGANEKGFPEDLESQMKLAYAAIQRTLAEFGADMSHIVLERVYTTDMEALIKTQEMRKRIYGEWRPAATWVEVKRLYRTEAKLEIELEAALPPSAARKPRAKAR
jgi:2-iminobutanoate/2-iminopropanoate deaminase